MKIKPIIILFFILLNCYFSQAQFTDRYWAFGDSSALDFKIPGAPVPSTSILRVRGTCASICDSSGNLIFYGGSPHTTLFLPPSTVRTEGFIINKNHQIISNGDSLRTTQWYQEMTIIPNPANANQFYIFQCGVTSTPTPGFSYSLVDISLNSGQGYVIQKNILLSTQPFYDAVVAVQHANGRDWWIISKPWDSNTPLNTYYVYLINQSGLSSPSIQSIGTTTVSSNAATMKFTKSGSKLYIACRNNLIESYDFDRCNGILSNTKTIHPVYTSGPSYFYDGMEISPDESKMYLSSVYGGSNQDTAIILQLNLNAANVFASRDTIATISKTNGVGPIPGNIQRGPDDKIYISTNYDIGDCGLFYLYCDTSSFFPENMNLSVINFPDSLRAACDIQLYSQYLGGHRSYWGLPNNPNYELGRLIGSPCDTLSVGILETTIPQPAFYAYYDKEYNTAFINAKNIKGNKVNLEVFDINGKMIFQELSNSIQGYFTKDFRMTGLAEGLYVIILQTEKEKLVKKMVKN